MIWSGVCMSLATLLMFPKECRNGATNGVYLCIQVLIPSLFPFMILSDFIVSSGIGRYIPRIIKNTVGRLFGLSADTTMIILLSAIGGYPVGAAGISSLYRKKMINETQAEQMSLFCVASGPGFLITYLGVVMLGNAKTGYILFVSQTIGMIILGLLSRLLYKPSSTNNPNSTLNPPHSFGEALALSVYNGIRSCSNICGLVVLFSAVFEVIIALIPENSDLILLTAFIEITGGTKLIAGKASIVFISAVCGFGGLCVHFQIFQQLKGIRISKVRFYIFRIIQSILNSIITMLLLKLFPVSSSVFSTISEPTPMLKGGVSGTIALIICSLAFLFSVKKKAINTADNQGG